MAVTQPNAPVRPPARGEDFKGRHLVIGTNVVISIIAAAAVVGLVQWGAYFKTAKADLTDRGVNSLSPGTERLIKDLNKKVRLTAMYFKTDIETEDQAKYRNKMADLLALYQGLNRSMIETEQINPLQDHTPRDKALQRVHDLPKFAEQSKPYVALIDKFKGDLFARLGGFVQSELAEIAAREQSGTDAEKDDLAQVRALLTRWQKELSLVAQDVDDAVNIAQPRYGAAQTALTTLATSLSRDFTNVINFSKQKLAKGADISPDVARFYSSAEDRYHPIVTELEGLEQTNRDLPRLEFEEILRDLAPTSNALLVETDDGAKVLRFAEIWPPMDPNSPGGNASFGQRLFKGEDKITSTILQLTQKEKVAVIFVRFDGPPAFMSLPGGQQPQFMQLKEVLEDANFTVNEWDLATSPTPPAIDPKPTRTIYVVLRPIAPPQNFQQQPPPKQFGEAEKKAVLDALGETPRALFFAGWAPGPFGPFPDPYPYNDYLNDKWGIHIAHDQLLINAMLGEKAGEFSLGQQSLFLTDFTRGNHVLVGNLKGDVATFPYVAPLEIGAKTPEGVTIDKLAWFEKTDRLWGVKDIQKYIEQARAMKGVRKEADDTYGPFNVAAAATKGEGKIVVVSSRDFMIDQIAMAPALVMTSEGLSMRQRNPGNVHLFLNTLHWLNDKTEWMDVGKPVDSGKIVIDEGAELTFIRTFVYSIWPGLALVCGGVAWWMRRR